jgi:hypothetical protein
MPSSSLTHTPPGVCLHFCRDSKEFREDLSLFVCVFATFFLVLAFPKFKLSFLRLEEEKATSNRTHRHSSMKTQPFLHTLIHTHITTINHRDDDISTLVCYLLSRSLCFGLPGALPATTPQEDSKKNNPPHNL